MCCPVCRYNPNKGELTLTSEKFPDREENRKDIVRILKALCEQGHSAFPNENLAQLEEERSQLSQRMQLAQ